MGTWIISFALAAAVALVLRRAVRQRRSAREEGGQGCGGCPYAGSCH